MNDMVTGTTLPMMSDDELIDVLVNSLYPGAKRTSAAMVISYCRAANLDPLQKPVHIVPMSVKSGGKDSYGNDIFENRDTIMPGIGLYRIQAARTGQYAGQDEPVIGPMREFTYQDTKREWREVPGQSKKRPFDTLVEKTIDYPEWVSVTVYRLVGGFRVAFTAREYWQENYATAGRSSDAPNSMWARRVIGQLVKCAEAQVLRKGFPEVGSQATAEEMEGRTVYELDAEPAEPKTAARPARASETAGAPATPALTDETAQQQANAALMSGNVATPKADPVPASAATATAHVAAPTPAPAPAPAQAPAPAAQTEEPASPPSSEGERMNVIVTARAKKIELADLVSRSGLKGVNLPDLAGLTKDGFKALKALLA